MSKKAQISVEYMILTGFILLVIIVPSSYLVFTMANKGVQGTINNQRAIDLGRGLIESAEQMYYLGLYSKNTVDYEVPENVERMFILKMEEITTEKEYYYFGMIINNGKNVTKHMFLSDVPIMSETGTYVDDLDDSDDHITECAAPSIYDCTYYHFKPPVINPGQKRFKIETLYNNNVGFEQTYVYIVPVMD